MNLVELLLSYLNQMEETSNSHHDGTYRLSSGHEATKLKIIEINVPKLRKSCVQPVDKCER